MKRIGKNKGVVYGGSDIWEELNRLINSTAPSKVICLTDSNTAKYCLPILESHLDSDIRISGITVPAGEAFKTIATCQSVWQQLSDLGTDRKSLMINLGGGVITDLGGFVACTFKRGIEFINIPTSLLAMVDASVGGKNGVDLGHIKNQIGVMQNPLAVFVDVAFLDTLPQPERNSGYAEMLKHGLIASEAYWNELKDFHNMNSDALADAIWKSIEIKNRVVTKDPNEKGERKTLNYGHTLGHAIESYCLESKDREPLLHGEAIAIGMVLANYISQQMLAFPKVKLQQTTSHFLHHFKRVSFDLSEIEKIIELLKFDKKNVDGNVNFVLLKDFGNYKIDMTVANDLIFNAFEYYKNFKN